LDNPSRICGIHPEIIEIYLLHYWIVCPEICGINAYICGISSVKYRGDSSVYIKENLINI
jgi:hypothetical protein